MDRKFSFIYFSRIFLVLLCIFSNVAMTFGQCPTSADYITIADGDWSNPSTWESSKVPPTFGSINNTISIPNDITLGNAGGTVIFQQKAYICGNLTIDGNLQIENGCDPLEVYGTLIVNGNLYSNQSIKVHSGAKAIVHGDWIVKNGSNTSIEGNMAVKGNVELGQGVNINTEGNLLMYGDCKVPNNGNSIINGNLVIREDIEAPSWYASNQTGNIYSISGDTFGSAITKNEVDLIANVPLYSLYQEYLGLFGLAPLTVTISGPEKVCAGSEITFTAKSYTATDYKFFVNSSPTPSQEGPSSIFTYTPADGDVVKVEVTDGVTTAEATSPAIKVNPLPKNNYTIAAPAMCKGSAGVATLSGSEVGVNYQIYHGSAAVGSAVAGTGAALDMPIPSSAVTGVYKILATNATTGCDIYIATSFYLSVNPLPTASLHISDADAKVCFGEEVILTANEGADKYEFFVDDAGQGEQDAADNTFTTSTLVAGSHDFYVKVTDANGCSNISAKQPLEILPAPNIVSFASNKTDNKICKGSEIQLTVNASNATSYEFFVGGVSQGVSTSNEFSTNSLTDGTVDVYAKVVSSVNGCPINTPVISFEVQQLPAATIDPQIPAEICAGSEVTFTATGGDSYQYYVNGLPVAGATNATFTSSTLTNGNIVSVAVTGSNGCVATATAEEMKVNPLPSAVLGSSDIDNIVCAGSDVTFTAPEMEGASYVFTVGGNTINKGNSNTYTTNTLTNGDKVSVKVTSDKGCVSLPVAPIDMVVQQKPGKPNPITGTNSVGGGTPTTITYRSGGLSSPDTYRWQVSPDGYGEHGDNGGQSFNVKWSSSGLFYLRVYGYNVGCGISDEYQEMQIKSSVSLSAAKTPEPNVSVFCKDSPITFTTSTGGDISGAFRYGFSWKIWTPSGGEQDQIDIKGKDNITFQYMPKETGTYKIKVANLYQTYALKIKINILWSSEFTFTVGDVPQNVGLTVDNNPVCKGAPAKITATANNADSYNFKVNGASQYDGGNNQFASSTFANNDKVTVVASNACGASALSAPITMQIREPEQVKLDVSVNPICNNGKTKLIASPSGSLEYTYFINGAIAAGPIAKNTYETDPGALINNSKVKVVMKDACGESVSNEITINTLPLPENVVISVSPSSTVCAGTPATFTATPYYETYQFKKNGVNVGTEGASNTFVLDPVAPGDKITVVVTDYCKNTAESKNSITMSVSPVPTPTLTFSPGTTICEGTTLTANAPTGWLNYDFLVNGASYRSLSLNTSSISGLKNGDKVSVVIKYACGGVDAYATSPEYAITVKPKPKVTLVADPASNKICAGTSVKFTATGGGTYQYTLNGTSIYGATNNEYTKSDIKDGDKIGIIVTLDGCSETESLPAYVISAPPVVQWESYSPQVCAGDVIDIKVKNVYDSYTWSVNAPFSFMGTHGQSAQILTGTNDELFPVGSINKIMNVDVSLVVEKGGCKSTVPAKLTIPVLRIPRTGPQYHLKNDIAK